MKYVINDLYGYPDYEYLNGVIERTLHHEHVENAIFSIVFVDNEEIHKMNLKYRGIDRPTDVISFAFEDSENFLPEGMRILGDIYISIPKMKEQAEYYGHSEKRELSFLVVHGLLHLLGYDHTKGKKEEEEMFQLQEEILQAEQIGR